jgi:tight adherence protein B
MTRAELERVANVVQRLSVLLAAGVAPITAWTFVDAEVAAIAATGVPIAPTLAARSSAWRGLAAAWSVATDAGAPLAPALRGFAASLRELARASREIDTALAGPIATARLVMVLPGVGVLFGLVLGFDTLGTLFTTPAGIACLIVGSALLVIARWWNHRLVARARRRDLTPGLRFDLVAIALGGGASVDRATAAVDVALAEAGLASTSSEVDAVDDVLDLSRRAGVPAAELLRSQAEEVRREACATAVDAASVLAVRLMLPLGVCILPAFMLLGVAPLLISVISSTVATF